LFETGAPQPVAPLPVEVPLLVDHAVHADEQEPTVPVTAAAGVGYEATSAILPAGPPPGTVTYRLRGTESSQGG
jgi:hypothetical protein